MGGLERLVVNLHGVGEPHPGVLDDELPYWCPHDAWPHFIDAFAELEQRSGVALELTCDDGNASDMEFVVPGLLERGLRATFFICAGRLDQRHYLSTDQVRDMRAAGMAIGSHGWAHRNLRALSDADLDLEVTGSQDTLSAAIGEPVDTFAIPFGSYDRRVLGRLKGWRSVYTSDPGTVGPGARLIPRYSYVTSWTPDTPLKLAVSRASLAERGRRLLARGVKRLR